MNWNAIAAIGELAGAVAVVVSLLYLARQIDQNTRAMRRTAAHEAVEGMLNWFSHALADPELSRIWTLGIERLDNPSEDEIAGFALLQFNLMKVAEDIHFQHMEGAMDPGLWEGWSEMFQQYLGAPGSQEYWEERRLLFSKQFQEWVTGFETDPEYLRTQAFARAEVGGPKQ
jgi:hypothetical protein